MSSTLDLENARETPLTRIAYLLTLYSAVPTQTCATAVTTRDNGDGVLTTSSILGCAASVVTQAPSTSNHTGGHVGPSQDSAASSAVSMVSFLSLSFFFLLFFSFFPLLPPPLFSFLLILHDCRVY